MYDCNRCGYKSPIITVPDAVIPCPNCGEGELVLVKPAVTLEAGLALVKFCERYAEQGRENIQRNRLIELREQYLKDRGR